MNSVFLQQGNSPSFVLLLLILGTAFHCHLSYHLTISLPFKYSKNYHAMLAKSERHASSCIDYNSLQTLQKYVPAGFVTLPLHEKDMHIDHSFCFIHL